MARMRSVSPPRPRAAAVSAAAQTAGGERTPRNLYEEGERLFEILVGLPGMGDVVEFDRGSFLGEVSNHLIRVLGLLDRLLLEPAGKAVKVLAEVEGRHVEIEVGRIELLVDLAVQKVGDFLIKHFLMLLSLF